MRHLTTTPRHVLSALAGFAVAAGAIGQIQVARETTGDRAVALAAMELKPFPESAWGTLSDWKGGEAVTAANSRGRVVVVLTWASWNRTAVRQGVSVAERLAKQFPEDVIVVAAHDRVGWDDEAAKLVSGVGPALRLAVDAKGDFRAALQVDQDPDFYLIDRAGQLRYADVVTGSVESAVRALVDETTEQASGVPANMAERAAREAEAARRHGDINPTADLTRLPPVPPGYADPDPALYELVRWPTLEDEVAKNWGLKDQNGQKQRVEFPLQAEEAAWLTGLPVATGRARVVYVWNPDMPRSYQGVMDQMDRLQRRHKRELVVVGAIVPVAQLQENRGFGNETVDLAALERKVRSFLAARNYEHSIVADVSASTLNIGAGGRSSGRFPVPGAVIVSSDNVVRWIGPLGVQFDSALQQVLLNDPGVKKVRELDLRYIERNR